jgi:hypothetical protein
MQRHYTTRRQEMTDDTDLGFGAAIIAEDEFGNYEPVNMPSSIREAKELIAGDYASRIRLVEMGKNPMHPARYVVWANGTDGFRKVFTQEEL